MQMHNYSNEKCIGYFKRSFVVRKEEKCLELLKPNKLNKDASCAILSVIMEYDIVSLGLTKQIIHLI